METIMKLAIENTIAVIVIGIAAAIAVSLVALTIWAWMP